MPQSHAAGRSLVDSMFAPLTVGDFLAEHFNRKSLHVRAEDPARFSTWFGHDRLTKSAWGSLNMSEDAPPASPLPCWAVNAEEMIPAEPRLAQDLFKMGMTLAINSIESNDAFVRDLLTDVTASLGFVGQSTVNCYLSPEGGGAFGQHFDDQHVIILQIEGKKHWRYGSVASAPNPRFSGSRKMFESTPGFDAVSRRSLGRAIDLPHAEDLEQVTLSPGDLLYLPPGTWHSTAAVDGPSLALTLTLVPYRVCDAIASFLTSHLLHEDAWYADMSPADPGGLASDARSRAMLDEGLSKLRAVLSGATAETVVEGLRRLADLPPRLLAEVIATANPRQPGADAATRG